MNDDRMKALNDALAITASAFSLYLIARMVFGPDVMNRLRMRGYLTVAHTANNTASALNSVALRSMTAYHKCRNVTV